MARVSRRRRAYWAGFIVPAILGMADARSAAQAAETVAQRPGHCAVASMETILRFYGEEDPLLSQRCLGLMHNARAAEYTDRKRLKPFGHYYPTFTAAYQPILAEMLLDRGYAAVSTRTSVSKDGQTISERVVQILVEHLVSGHWAVLHVPGHYMAITGYDRQTRTIWFNDPWRPQHPFTVGLADFINPKRSWHTNRGGEPRAAWDGRVLIFWKPQTDEERMLNATDRCPACGEFFPETAYTYCRRCRTFIDRRQDAHVQRGLDLIALSTQGFDQTNVSRERMLALRDELQNTNPISETAWREALANYPLAPLGAEGIVTLYRAAPALGIRPDELSTAELEQIVTSGEGWYALLAEL